MSLEFSERELAAIRSEFCPGFTDDQFEVALAFCKVRNLLPGKHVVFQKRVSKEWDESANAKVPVTKIIFITTIDASRLIAQRTGKYAGQAPEEYIYLSEEGTPSVVSTIPLPQLPLKPGTSALPREPWAVRTNVFHKDFPQPVTSVARFDAYASTYKSANGPVLNEMWARRGPEQLAKCSEMLSLRKAFPEELGSLYIAEEFKVEAEETPTTPVTPSVAVPALPSAPKVNQQPAVPTDAPRPGEQGAEALGTVRGHNPQEAKTEFHVTEVPATLPAHSGDTLKVVPKEEAKEAAIKAVPDLKPASELPAPTKKKGGRPAKAKEAPAEVPGQITNADIPTAENPLPPVEVPEDPKVGQDFVASLDPTPTKEEQGGFTARVRALAAAGALNADLKNYILNVGKKADPKQLTVRDWNLALEQLEAALGESKDKLKEITKAAPLPKF